ncbi:hypothetical protein [Chitinophaga nivalis]|uniref:DUF4890 domain-containing protein n=1 Tax=Chitinophaga nivalis TaxID=2991709 RepID=A0ABT3IEH0_9BACT|nr:hypothetical protein [Chitinophaga nivalis]MCW3467955.1 hypothetical protein [Chitinophaga nivalis]MCW3482354.1 hypothetical protein [Chitinophaga nivalis]
MKYITVYTILLLLCISSAVQVHAQADSSHSRGRWSAEGRADKITDKIARELSLDKQQSKQILSINQDIVRRLDLVHMDKSLTKKERMQQYRTLDAERSQRFKTVLNATQYKKWNDWELKKKEHLEAKMEKKRQRKAARDASQTE